MSNERKAKVWTSTVTLRGMQPGIMFDRYLGANTTKVAPQDKLYLDREGCAIIPSTNVISLLTAINTRSAPKVLFDARKYQEKTTALLGNLSVTPFEIPITRGGERVRWRGEFDDGPGGPSGIVLDFRVARLAKGIPNPKERPVILAPWEVTFQVELFDNEWVAPSEFQWILERGMAIIGLGSYRGVFGKAEVEWS